MRRLLIKSEVRLCCTSRTKRRNLKSIQGYQKKVRQLLNVSYLVLEGLRCQSFVEWCKVSGKILKVVLDLLFLKRINKCLFVSVLATGDIVTSNLSL